MRSHRASASRNQNQRACRAAVRQRTKKHAKKNTMWAAFGAAGATKERNHSFDIDVTTRRIVTTMGFSTARSHVRPRSVYHCRNAKAAEATVNITPTINHRATSQPPEAATASSGKAAVAWLADAI